MSEPNEYMKRTADEVLELHEKCSKNWKLADYWFNCDSGEPDCHIEIDGKVCEILDHTDGELIVHYRSSAPLLAKAYKDLQIKMAANPEALAKKFHETYELLAPNYGYETRKESAKPWDEVPEQNKRLMIAVCGQIITYIAEPSNIAKKREE